MVCAGKLHAVKWGQTDWHLERSSINAGLRSCEDFWSGGAVDQSELVRDYICNWGSQFVAM
jgi:hypothetical protein